jgi:hypothetical protein
VKVIKRATMPNGTKIQIEDWSGDYSFAPYGGTVAAYPKAKVSHEGAFAPKGNETFRAGFNFPTTAEAKTAFERLESGKGALSDYVGNMERPEYADCL